MFLCAREASAGPRGASDVTQAPPPSTADDAASSSYLQLLDALTRLVARLLDVHTLSPSLRFEAGESVAVDAAEWWREVQRRSIAQQEAANGHAEQKDTPTGNRLWPLTRAQETPEEDKTPRDSGPLSSSETFEDLSEDTLKDNAAPLFVQALYLILQAMDRVSKTQEDQKVDAQALVDTLASVDTGVAFAAAQLLQMWAPVSQKTHVDSTQKLSTLMGVAVVNALLQPTAVGTKHSFHDHALLPSLPLRAFLGAKHWTCSVCERVTQTGGSDAARAVCVYRCAACNFNLCRECFTRIPNAKGSRRSNPLADMTRLTTDRFFGLVVPQLRHKTGAVVVRQIAQELRRRVLEMYLHNFEAAAEFAQLFLKLVASDKAAALALVTSPPASMPSSSGRPAVAWFPLFMRTWTMSMNTLLGPFLRASTMLDDTREIESAVRAANHGSAVADCLRAQWTSGYAEFRITLQTLMKTLLSNDQHPVVADATLCWLALTLMTADPRRRLNYDAHERLDGFLVNITTMLLAYTLPLLDKAQYEPSWIDSHYHQSVEPVRVYASKDFPEVPLHYSRSTQDASATETVAGTEMSEIQLRDESCIAEYNARRIRRDHDGHDEEDKEVGTTYYPRLSCHEGVVCDRCEFANIHNVSVYSSSSAFPEHFFFDLCDVVYLLGLEKLEYRELVAELKRMKGDGGSESQALDEVEEIVEPLLIMLTQIVVAPKFTKNPHLRVEALRSLTTLLTFVSKGQQVQHRPGHRRMEALFKRHSLLSRYLIPGLLQFHSDMDRYNASNNGLAFTSAATSGDHMLWGFLSTRVSVTMLLRYLWQLPSQRQSLLQMLKAPEAIEISQASLSEETNNGSTQQLTGLVSGLWSDIAKLFDEAHIKIATLRQIHDLIEDSLDGSVVVLPFRRDMLDGYVAINAKQLRLTMRLLLEALELTSWFAAIVSGECSSRSRSLSAPATALRHVLLQPLVVEQAARTLSFLVASLANAHEEKEWVFSLPLVEDGKLLLAHLIVLVVRYSGHSALPSSDSSSSLSFCSPSSFWKIVRSSGDIMEKRVGDLDTHVRWGLNALCTRIESESYLGSSLDDDDDDIEEVRVVAEAADHELDEDEALALLEKQSEPISSSVGDTITAKKRLGKRFIATLAKDGRVDFRQFVGGYRFLRPHRKADESSSSDEEEEAEDMEGGYLYLDDSWVQQFVRAMHEADEMIHVQEAMEACLGDIPDQYLDPLLSTLMTDPVRLPSGNVVDRAVIARHLLAASQQGGSTGRDPFTREPLTMAMVEPCDALRSEIRLYLRTKMRHFRKTAREDVLATWGLGWDVLFDSSSETEADSEDGAKGGNNATTSSTSS
ncbi:hypothetical protein PF003_g7642 [Phytophthora fragariae]|nr:hypothetical protein PF003_g7642 [Phytophthora fragariae]